MIPKNWYIQQETRRRSTTWDLMSQDFVITFTIILASLKINATLSQIKQIILYPTQPSCMQEVVICMYHIERHGVQQLAYY